MQQVRKTRDFRRTTGQIFTDRSRPNHSMEYPAPRQEIQELKGALAKEKALCSDQQNRIKELSEQLDKTNEELKRQKTLKEMFINKGKETKRELERLKAYCNPNTLSTANIAAQVRNTTREKKKKVLHKDYEQLQVAHIISQEKFTAELQAETEKNRVLQTKLDTIEAKYDEINKELQDGINRARQQADSLQFELEKESQQKMILLKYYEELQEIYKHSKETLTAELQAEREKKTLLQQELDSIKHSCHEGYLRYETEVASVRQQAGILQRELEKESQQKIVLQKEYEELQAAHMHSQEMSSAQLQGEREKNKLLQEKLENISVSYRDISQSYEVDVLTDRQKVYTLQHELEKERQQRTTLQKEYEGLQAAHMHSQETSSAELQGERDKNKLLQEDLEKIRGSYQEISQRYETDVLNARQQTDSLQCQLDKEIKEHSESLTEGWNAINKLKAEKEILSQKMMEESDNMQQKVRLFERELEELKTQLNVQISHNYKLTTELDAKRKDDPPPRNMTMHEEKCEDEPHLAHQEEAEISEETPQPKTSSMWKKTRHFLGFRKPQKRKNDN